MRWIHYRGLRGDPSPVMGITFPAMFRQQRPGRSSVNGLRGEHSANTQILGKQILSQGMNTLCMSVLPQELEQEETPTQRRNSVGTQNPSPDPAEVINRQLFTKGANFLISNFFYSFPPFFPKGWIKALWENKTVSKTPSPLH